MSVSLLIMLHGLHPWLVLWSQVETPQKSQISHTPSIIDRKSLTGQITVYFSSAEDGLFVDEDDTWSSNI